MAIIGLLNDIDETIVSSERIQQGLAYLKSVNMTDMFEKVTEEEPLKIELDGDKLFAIFQKYQSKERENILFEAHRKYIDIQLVNKGEEEIWVAPLSTKLDETEYDSDKDIHFMKASYHSISLMKPQNAAILFPTDLHAPGISVVKPEAIEKVVVKVAVK
ncbi:DUF386 domain-containing protein [Prolixibacteraceae bacterium JC049]|nr:DUF386 domain-containing protein [Prolixibacteraceae bacterium JC049]